MRTLLLTLAGPMQSWGSSSRFTRRATEHAPTKSGVIGLLAAAKGLRRNDPLEDLLTLSFGVRIDQPGRIERDFHTTSGQPLTDRYYLSDAIFLAAVHGDDSVIHALDHAVRNPQFPLFLGRRAFAPAGPVRSRVREGTLWESLSQEDWQASTWWRQRQGPRVQLELRLDEEAAPAEAVKAGSTTVLRDEPESFDPELRSYGWRSVVHTVVEHDNPDARNGSADGVRNRRSHDPMSALGGA